jgi:hypothetical protein
MHACHSSTRHFDYDFLVFLVCPLVPPCVCLLTRLGTASYSKKKTERENSLEASMHAPKNSYSSSSSPPPSLHVYIYTSHLHFCCKLDSFDHCAVRIGEEAEKHVSFFPLFALSLSLSLSLFLSRWRHRRRIKKKRRKKKKERTYFRVVATVSSLLPHVLLIIIAVRCPREIALFS